MRLSRFWSGIAVAAMVSGLAVAGTEAALASPAAGPTVSIAAKSLFPVVTHDVFVSYKNGKFGNATVSGSISSTTAGEVATLYAQPFPFTKAAQPVAGQSMTLGTSTTPVPYSFSASPTIATKYSVEVFASSSSTTPLASSSRLPVYVVTNQLAFGVKNCSRPVCHQSLRVFTHLPASALRTESAKKWYFYFGLKLSRTGEPKPPAWLYLSSHVRISKARRVSATQFERTLTFSFTIHNDGYFFNVAFCSKDTESKDGINLPGHHGCGTVKRVSGTKFEYLG